MCLPSPPTRSRNGRTIRRQNWISGSTRRNPFYDACTALADKRRLNEVEFEGEGTFAPWGAQLSAHFQKSVAQRLFLATVSRMPAPLNAENR